MPMFSWLKRSAPLMESKSVSTPELLMLWSRTAPVFQKWDTETAIEQGLKASAVFYACVQKRAQSLAQIPWQAKRRMSDGTYEDAPDSDLQRLLDRPNPDFALAEMMELLAQHIDLAGNAYWTIIRTGNGNQPRELWPVYPQGMKIKAGTERLIGLYRYQYGGITKDINPEDVVHIKTCNPNDFLFGLPTIQAAGRAVDIDRDAGEWQKNSLHNRGVSDYAIVIDPDTDEAQIDRLRELHKQKQAGKDNARQPYLTTKDIKTLNQSAVEMDFVNSRVQVWTEICSAMGVPLPMVGILENATLANIETSRKIFWLDTMIPMLRMVRGQLNQQLARDFGPEWFIDYDLSGVEALREDTTKKVETAERLFRMGVPLNRINDVLEMDLGEIAGGDVGYITSSLIPTSGLGEPAEGEEGMPVQDVQQTALNGAQIGSMREIAQAVSDGMLPAETAIELIRVSFPTVDEQQARRIIGPAASFNPAKLEAGLELLSKAAYGPQAGE